MPYRTISSAEHAEAPRDAGIVGDIIAQFADRYAFYRELIQNSIDAGSPSVEIELVHDTRVMIVRVRDRGEGMTRDILENQLLVLFRSTKEHDDTKIGKFGIGFASVLASNPNVVVVQTAREGRRLTLHLHRDLTYQIFDAGAATQAGTTVELELAMTVEEARTFAQQSLAAVVRWCRHATVPIELRAEVPGLDPPIAARIDRPLGLDDAVVEVSGTSEDGKLVAVVGVASDGGPYGGFFNHGLTLYETREPLVGNLAFKIQDARLGHTLSRDNVRRDENFTRALGVVRSLAENQLPKTIQRALRATAGTTDPGRFLALARAVIASEIGLPPSAWEFPLVDAVGGRTAIGGEALGQSTWMSARRSALSKALAAADTPVLRLAGVTWLLEYLRGPLGITVNDIDHHLTLVTPLALAPADHYLVDQLHALFAVCKREPATILLAKLEGAGHSAVAIAGGPDDAAYTREPRHDGPYIVGHEIAFSTPFTRLRKRALVLNANHALVKAARTSLDPALAASHLARVVLLHHRLLDVPRSAAILDYTLARLGVG